MEESNQSIGGSPGDEGLDLEAGEPLPDVPDAPYDSVPITPPDPIDFSTKGITAAGSIGTSTFNDGDDRTFFERTVAAFEESDVDNPMLGDGPSSSRRRRARVYGDSSR